MQAESEKGKKRKKDRLGSLAGWLLALTALKIGLERSPGESHWLGYCAMAFPAAALAYLAGLMALGSAMRKRARAAITFAVTAGLALGLGVDWASGTPSDDEADLRVMTMNVQRCLVGIEQCAQIIREADADVVCLQDADAYGEMGVLPPALARELPEYDVRTYWQMVVLSRLEVRSHRWVVMAGGDHRRTLFEAIVETPKGPVRVLNTHWPRLSPRSVLVRPWTVPQHASDVSARQTVNAQTVIREATGDNMPTVLCGDFNRPPRGEVYELLDGTFEDAWARVGRGPGFTYPQPLPVMRLDYQWVRGLEPIRIRRIGNGKSDHLGLVADYRVRGS